MDFNNYQFKLTIKSICLFEQLSGKSFFECSTEDDTLMLVYCILVTNNPSLFMTYPVFQGILGNKKIRNWVTQKYTDVMGYLKQFKQPEHDNGKNEGEGTKMTITRIASSLIIQHKVDARYVMQDMELWEITPFLEVADDVNKARMVEQRFWTYLTVAPHIDTKKVKSPQALITFDWEKENNKKAALEDLEKKQDMIKDFFRRQRELKKQREEENGRLNDDIGPAGPGGSV